MTAPTPTTSSVSSHDGEGGTLIAPSAVDASTKPAEIFERTPCLKCGTTGRIVGFSHVMNGVCFGCGGAGYRLTKRGAVARAFFDSLGKCPVSTLRVGDRIIDSTTRKWTVVKRIGDNAVERRGGHILREDRERDVEMLRRYREEGATVEKYSDYALAEVKCWIVYSGINIETSRCVIVGSDGAHRVRVADPDTRLARMRAAADFQLALTKTGRPRKASRYYTEASR
jgi:hypothetical protein